MPQIGGPVKRLSRHKRNLKGIRLAGGLKGGKTVIRRHYGAVHPVMTAFLFKLSGFFRLST
jgi:hypothetical protein